MSSVTGIVPDVFTSREIADAAGVQVRDVQALLASGAIEAIDGRFVPQTDAVRAVRILHGGETVQADRPLFRRPPGTRRSPGGALAASGALHLAALGCLVLLATMGVATAPEERETTPVRLVFLATPGPGGGGGGGGLRQPAPPPKAEKKGTSPLRSPVPPPRPITSKPPDPKPQLTPPVTIQPVPKPVEPPAPPPQPVPLPQVVAPVATAPADTRDRAGVLTDSSAESNSHGPGTGSGAGTGQGTGIGEGTGAGIGPGSGGGTGGGPYRPGSGITPPAIVREVKPDYTEEARRRGVEGDVELEIVVRADGGVGSVTLIHGLGSGLDQRAIDAVRQWRFSPARRFGTPVDVIVEVAVEFKLR
jgi:periplasmic protein TonB